MNLSNEVNYSVYQPNLNAIERAIKERVFYVQDKDKTFKPPPQVDENIFLKNMSVFAAHIDKQVQFSTPMSSQQFVDSYQGRRRLAYQRAKDYNDIFPLVRKFSYIRAFVKIEKYNFTLKPNAVPRIIQPRDSRYIVESGRYVKPIEKKVYKCIDTVFDSPTIMKGKNAEERGAVIHTHWNSFRNPVAVGLDASRFDQHVSATALRWEHTRYEHYYPRDRYFKMLMRWQRTNKAFARCAEGTLKYNINRNRMSGDVNTALGNCLIMSGLVWSYVHSLAITVRLVNDGDDCVVFMEQEDLERFNTGLKEWFLTMGFSMTVEEPVYELELVVFCQCQPVFDGHKYVMVRDPRTAISKDCVAIKPLDNVKIYQKWCSAVGHGGISLTGGIPVWQNFYHTFVRASNGAKQLIDSTLEGGLQMMSRGMHRELMPVDDQSRLSFWRAFGITPESQIAIEDIYDAHNTEYLIRNDLDRYVLLPM